MSDEREQTLSHGHVPHLNRFVTTAAHEEGPGARRPLVLLARDERRDEKAQLDAACGWRALQFITSEPADSQTAERADSGAQAMHSTVWSWSLRIVFASDVPRM